MNKVVEFVKKYYKAIIILVDILALLWVRYSPDELGKWLGIFVYHFNKASETGL